MQVKLRRIKIYGPTKKHTCMAWALKDIVQGGHNFFCNNIINICKTQCKQGDIVQNVFEKYYIKCFVSCHVIVKSQTIFEVGKGEGKGEGEGEGEGLTL